MKPETQMPRIGRRSFIGMFNAPRSTLHPRSGQAMLLAIVTIGGTMLGATAIAGLLTLYQLRQAGDVVNSAKAIYGADAGLERGLFEFFRPAAASAYASADFTNGASYAVACYRSQNPTSADVVPCSSASTTLIRVIGGAGNTRRAFELSF